MDNCIFCKIALGQIPSNKIFEDDFCLAFYDVAPVAPKHVLIIPKKHCVDVRGMSDEEIGRLIGVAKSVASEIGLDENGYRIVINTGDDGGQTVFHTHIHVIGGRQMAWPPG